MSKQWQEQVGRRFRSARERSGISVDELAERLGVSPQSIYAYQEGRNAIPFELAPDCAREVGVSLEYLATGSEPLSIADALTEWALEFADRVAAGEDPAAVHADKDRGASPLSPRERARLSANAPLIRAYLDHLTDVPWAQLPLEERRRLAPELAALFAPDTTDEEGA